MSKKEKIISRFLSRPKDFSYEELIIFLKIYGYNEVKAGKTSGSRRAFYRQANGHIIRLHKPHPGNILRMYQIDYIILELKKQHLI